MIPFHIIRQVIIIDRFCGDVVGLRARPRSLVDGMGLSSKKRCTVVLVRADVSLIPRKPPPKQESRTCPSRCPSDWGKAWTAEDSKEVREAPSEEARHGIGCSGRPCRHRQIRHYTECNFGRCSSLYVNSRAQMQVFLVKCVPWLIEHVSSPTL